MPLLSNLGAFWLLVLCKEHTPRRNILGVCSLHRTSERVAPHLDMVNKVTSEQVLGSTSEQSARSMSTQTNAPGKMASRLVSQQSMLEIKPMESRGCFLNGEKGHGSPKGREMPPGCRSRR